MNTQNSQNIFLMKKNIARSGPYGIQYDNIDHQYMPSLFWPIVLVDFFEVSYVANFDPATVAAVVLRNSTKHELLFLKEKKCPRALR